MTAAFRYPAYPRPVLTACPCEVACLPCARTVSAVLPLLAMAFVGCSPRVVLLRMAPPLRGIAEPGRPLATQEGARSSPGLLP